MSEVRIGLLGHGTVGSAFAKLLESRADAVEAACGRRPVVAGVLRRSEGDFEEILAGSDVIVELIGGIEPARDYVLSALSAGKPVVTANKQLVARTAASSSTPPARRGSSFASRPRSPARSR